MNEDALDESNLVKLQVLSNKHVMDIVQRYMRLCRPKRATVITGSREDATYVRELARRNGEETPLRLKGHTVHFDGYYDQGRDREQTKVLVPKGKVAPRRINTGDRDECLDEIFSLLKGSMAGKEMLVCFFCLGPSNSKFSIPALQITDSAYVTHSEMMLYRPGWEDFRKLDGSGDFFSFIHSAGEVENGVSKNVAKKRIYIDLQENRVFSVNTQYAGNSVGLKKLALRLAIKRSHEQGWLSEHMLIMGAKPDGKNRVTYFTGAFPSACGKTSTAMIPGQTIVGDDIAYLKLSDDGRVYAANSEQGIFGIIENVNPVDDPLLYKVITTERELIFSNVLVREEKPFWLGMGSELPTQGLNYAGEWKLGDKDKEGNEILPAHRNARYTVRLQELENADPKLNGPQGVPVSGIIYGGRDSDTCPPVLQSFDWPHGVFVGASLESETTAATLGRVGVRTQNPMANLDFIVVPLGAYVGNHFRFGERLTKPPRIFATNYFLKENGKFLNEKVDKKVWLMWMEGRVHNEYGAAVTPIGFIPVYENLKELFRRIFGREYTKEGYVKQFSVRVSKLEDRLGRIEGFYREEVEVPEAFWQQLSLQRRRLLESKEKHGKDVISPFDFAVKDASA